MTNEDYAAGRSTSVAAGVRTVRERDAVLLALDDMPDVAVETVDLLVAAYRKGAGTALAAASDGLRGNPVLFSSRHFDDLCDVDGDIGGREILLQAAGAAAVETGDPAWTRLANTTDSTGPSKS